MATRPRVVNPETVNEDGEEWRVPVGTVAEVETPDEESDLLERLRGMLSQSGTTGAVQRVSLYRVDPKSPNLIWCANYTPTEFADGDLSMIREQWGPGLYEARVIGAKGISTKGRFQIANAVQSVGAVAVHNPGNDALAQALQSLANSQAAILQALNTRPDPQAEMLRNLDMLRMMREAFAPPPAAPVGPAVDPVQQITSLLGALRALKEASGEFQTENDEGGPGQLMGLAGSVIDLVKGNMQPQGMQPMQLPPSLSMPPHRVRIAHNPSEAGAEGHAQDDAAPISSPVAETAHVPETMEILILRGTLQGLLKLAERKASATVGGEYIAEKLPAELLPYLDLPNWFEILSRFALQLGITTLGDHQEWLTTARDEAIRILDEDEKAA